MRRTGTNGWMGRMSPKGGRLVAVALGVGLLVAAGAARAGDDDEDDKTFEEKVIEGIMKGMGATNMENSSIEYRERSPLVVPRKLELPPPSAAAEKAAPNWPKDPDEARRRAAIAARKKDKKDTRDATTASIEAARPLSPSELNAAKQKPTKDSGSSDSLKPGDPGSNPLMPSELGYSAGIMGMFRGGSKTESAEFKQEPTRDSLTQPPPGYQTPSTGFLYGTGPKESLNKEYNPAAGKYGD